jgi:hypothetical protein
MDPALDSTGFFTRIAAWAKKPVTSDLDLLGLALTVVFIATVVFLYHRLLGYITETV